MKRGVATEEATSCARIMNAHGYLIPRRPPDLFQPGMVREENVLSTHRTAAKTTVQVQTKLDHHQLLGPEHTVDQISSNNEVCTSH